MKVVPLPVWVWKVIVPSWASIRRLTTASPKPCPLDFVVKSGVKSLVWISCGMPWPVSLMFMHAWLFWHVADIFRVPPFGMAWTAFWIRLIRARFSMEKSAGKVGKSLGMFMETCSLLGMFTISSASSMACSILIVSLLGLRGLV